MSSLGKWIWRGLCWVSILSLGGRLEAIPERPTDRRDRFGMYYWNTEFPGGVGPEICREGVPSWGCVDRLNWGAELSAATGSRTLRVYLGVRSNDYYWRTGDRDRAVATDIPYPSWDSWAQELYLARIVAGASYDPNQSPYSSADTPYARLFRDGRFNTYMLTVYSPGANDSNWSNGLTEAERWLEQEQIRHLGEFLLNNFPTKRFILLNWEGDNAVLPLTVPIEQQINSCSSLHSLRPQLDTIWNGFRDWINARAQGVELARGWDASRRDRLLSGLEWTQPRRRPRSPSCGDTSIEDPSTRTVIHHVGPQVQVDYFSYSSWDTMGRRTGDPNADLATGLREDLTSAFRDFWVDERRIILGEWGTARTIPALGECEAGRLTRDVLEAVEAGGFQISYAVFWQIVDNEANAPTPASCDHVEWITFGSWRGYRNYSKSYSGQVFEAFLSGSSIAPPSSCPQLPLCSPTQLPSEPANPICPNGSPADRFHSCAVSSQTVRRHSVTPGEAVTLNSCGNSFSSWGNAVWLYQGGSGRALAIEYESASQIRALIPGDATVGAGILFVSNQYGVESNGQCVQILAAAAPETVVNKSGSGLGAVTSSPAGISCGSDCTERFALQTYVTLNAQANAGSVFAGWSGACSGSGPTCSFYSTQARSVVATFNHSGPPPGYQGCYTDGTNRALPAHLASGETIEGCKQRATALGYAYAGLQYYGQCFAGNQLGWSLVGDWECNTPCSANPTQMCGGAWRNSIYATGVTPPRTLSVGKTGSGTGLVYSSPGGIHCGGTCSANYSPGSWVTLYAAPDAGSTFAGWSGAGCSGTGTCTVTLWQATQVTASFNAAPSGPTIHGIYSQDPYGYWRYEIYPWSTLIVSGQGFSPWGGNTVQLQRPGFWDVWLYQGDGYYYWDFSANQINSSLGSRTPGGGWWTATVRDSSGRPSAPFSFYIY